MTDNHLQLLIEAQEKLQVDAYGGKSPRNLVTEDKVEFLTWNVLALTDELHELLAETSWKPWAKSTHLNEAAAKGEAIDALHFLLNIFIALGMSGEEVIEKYFAKRQKNIDRQEAGYDGVSTKCPECKRALDDDAVDCYVWELNGLKSVYCSVHYTNTRVNA